jgi:hypothetical protein
MGYYIADVVKHVANALESSCSTNANKSLQKIMDSFIKELGSPSSGAKGAFARKN